MIGIKQRWGMRRAALRRVRRAARLAQERRTAAAEKAWYAAWEAADRADAAFRRACLDAHNRRRIRLTTDGIDRIHPLVAAYYCGVARDH